MTIDQLLSISHSPRPFLITTGCSPVQSITVDGTIPLGGKPPAPVVVTLKGGRRKTVMPFLAHPNEATPEVAGGPVASGAKTESRWFARLGVLGALYVSEFALLAAGLKGNLSG